MRAGPVLWNVSGANANWLDDASGRDEIEESGGALGVVDAARLGSCPNEPKDWLDCPPAKDGTNELKVWLGVALLSEAAVRTNASNCCLVT